MERGEKDGWRKEGGSEEDRRWEWKVKRREL